MCIKYFWVRIHIPFVLDKYLWNAGNNGRIPQLQSPKTWVAHYAMRNDNRFQVTRAAGSRAAGRVTAGHLMPSPESQPAPQYGSRPHGAVIFWQAAAGTLPGLRIRTLAPNSAEGHPTHPKATGQRAAGCGFHLTFCTKCKMGTKPACRHCSSCIETSNQQMKFLLLSKRTLTPLKIRHCSWDTCSQTLSASFLGYAATFHFSSVLMSFLLGFPKEVLLRNIKCLLQHLESG